MRYFICLSYNGTRYHGWQVQENAPTVQGELHRALGIVLGEPTATVGAGRTDAGVHARRYVAHFDSGQTERLADRENIVYRLNGVLPSDICIHGVYPMHDAAHARFDATERTYKYYIHTEFDPFLLEVSAYIPYTPDVNAMNEACKILLTYEDFTSFAKLHSDNKTNLCTLTQAKWEIAGNRLVFTISANRFLRNMVRAIVGVLLEVGRGKYTTDNFVNLIEMRKPGAGGISSPARGLFLEEIRYPYSWLPAN